MRSLLTLFLITFCLSGFADVTISQPAPNFSLPGNDGQTYQLSDLKGKFVVLEWFNNECPYVEKHYDQTYKNMQKLQDEWVNKLDSKKGKNKKEVVWLSIISSAPGKQGHVDPAGATKIKEERHAHMNAILLDPDGKVGKLYGAKTTPHMYIIDPEGVLRYNGAIDDQPSANVKSLSGAKNYVSAALDSLFMGRNVAVASTKPYGCSVKY